MRADEANGVELFGDDELDRDVDGDVIVAGFFALWKSLHTDRTITARLAQNRRERSLGLSASLLAHGVLLAEILLRDDEKARMSGRDLPDAHHHAMVSMLRAKTYALGSCPSLSSWAGVSADGRAEESCRQEAGGAGESARQLAQFGDG